MSSLLDSKRLCLDLFTPLRGGTTAGGVRNGPGIQFLASGVRVRGFWRDNELTGEAAVGFPESRAELRGLVESGRLVSGELRYDSGARVEGEFRPTEKGDAFGRVTFTFASGHYLKASYDEGGRVVTGTLYSPGCLELARLRAGRLVFETAPGVEGRPSWGVLVEADSLFEGELLDGAPGEKGTRYFSVGLASYELARRGARTLVREIVFNSFRQEQASLEFENATLVLASRTYANGVVVSIDLDRAPQVLISFEKLGFQGRVETSQKDFALPRLSKGVFCLGNLKVPVEYSLEGLDFLLKFEDRLYEPAAFSDMLQARIEAASKKGSISETPQKLGKSDRLEVPGKPGKTERILPKKEHVFVLPDEVSPRIDRQPVPKKFGSSSKMISKSPIVDRGFRPKRSGVEFSIHFKERPQVKGTSPKAPSVGRKSLTEIEPDTQRSAFDTASTVQLAGERQDAALLAALEESKSLRDSQVELKAELNYLRRLVAIKDDIIKDFQSVVKNPNLLLDESVTYFRGQIKEGVKQGYCEEVVMGAFFSGFYLDGMREGEGELIAPRFVYSGHFSGNKMDGKGRKTYPDVKKTLEGTFVDGCFAGNSLRYGGLDYEGEIVEDKMNGQGKLTFANRSVLRAKFANDEPMEGFPATLENPLKAGQVKVQIRKDSQTNRILVETEHDGSLSIDYETGKLVKFD